MGTSLLTFPSQRGTLFTSENQADEVSDQMRRHGDLRALKACDRRIGRLALSAESSSALWFGYYYPCPIVGGPALHGWIP